MTAATRIDTSPIDPTGLQTHLRRDGAEGEVTAQIAQVGASLRALTVGGVDIVARYPEGTPTPFGSGIVLAPWPNRVRDGRWNDGGTARQLDITEPDRSNAIHGLLRYAPYAIDASEHSATLTASIHPQHGYPYTLRTAVTYALTDTGVEVTHEVANVGEGDAPVALGTHPFFCIGGVPTEDLVLALPAQRVFEVDDRLLPLREAPVAGASDLRDGARVGSLDLDTGFGSLVRGADGLALSTLTAPDGRVVTLWQDENWGYIQAFNTTRYPGQSMAVAVEPMTAPTDAFNSGVDLRRLAPGSTWTARWGVRFSGR
ncbi:aldose 1-epimerase family protein [Microbacterium marinilacus]|uniref:Aldose 1-epimerase family protein n=1 Tax=Microbacterium marinilacus TaxID=415209 RepID=A0ABP7BI67_9MICO|nr:aldose 1-epimerase family protein [Microbacterium marinilacus]